MNNLTENTYYDSIGAIRRDNIMKYKLIEEEGVYDLSVYFEDTLNDNNQIKLGSLLIDTKRNQYYILPEEGLSEETIEFFKNEMFDNFIKEIGYRVNPNSLVGEIKSYSDVILEKLVLKYEIEKIGYVENEKKATEEYISNIQSYNLGTFDEYSMYKQMR